MLIYTRNKEVEAYNNRKLNIRNLIALVESKNMGRALLISDKNFNGLSLSFYFICRRKGSIDQEYFEILVCLMV